MERRAISILTMLATVGGLCVKDVANFMIENSWTFVPAGIALINLIIESTGTATNNINFINNRSVNSRRKTPKH